MAEIGLMSATESVVSCSPTMTLISEGDAPAVQWAAVSTWRVESSEPPHQGLLPVLDTRPTCHMTACVSKARFKPSNSHLPWILIDLRLHSPDDP